jgi:hypothetical protein
MQDDEIRIACINAVVAWTGSSNKLQDAQAFYDWIIAGREVPIKGNLQKSSDTKPMRTKGKTK